jgi:hypothetical protein
VNPRLQESGTTALIGMNVSNNVAIQPDVRWILKANCQQYAVEMGTFTPAVLALRFWTSGFGREEWVSPGRRLKPLETFCSGRPAETVAFLG